jgi:hypothetical protein
MKKLLLILLCLPILGYSQTFVSTTPENKNVVLEEFTGIYCTFCPDGHVIAQALHDANPNDVFIIKIHTGGYATPNGPNDPDFQTIYGGAIGSASGLAGYPAGTINRSTFSSISPQGSAGSTALSRGSWPAAATLIMADPSEVNVAAQANYDMGSGVLTVNTESYFTSTGNSGTYNLHVAVVMNNVAGPQSGASNFNPGAIIPGPWSPTYNHQQMMVHLMDGATGLAFTSSTAGTFVPNTHTWSVPAQMQGDGSGSTTGFFPDHDPTNFDVVAYITESATNTIVTGFQASVIPIFPNQYDANVTASSANDVVCASTTDIEVTFKNYGSDTLTSLDLTYDINSGTPFTYNWIGNMASGATETVAITNVSFTPQASNTVNWVASNPNGHTDQNLSNNSSFANFIHFDQDGQVVSGISPGNINIDITTDAYGSETTWEIVGEDGIIYASGGPYSNNTTYNIDVTVPAGQCFEFILYDSYGDGMCCTNGIGSCYVYDDNIVYVFQGNYTNLSNFSEIREQFSTGIPIYGCTDSTTSNYDPLATADDGSCIYIGCMYSLSCNYSPLATIDDGSCIAQIDTTWLPSVTICGNNYTFPWGGSCLCGPGLKTITYFNVNGECDSTVAMYLITNSLSYNTIFDTVCGNYLWNGNNYNSSGTYYWTGQNSAGCDSSVTLNLTILDTFLTTTHYTACDSYTWNGTVYDSSGVYSNIYVFSNGCDSTIALDLTINNSSNTTISITSCDSYVWDGITYDSTDQYTNQYTNLNGCDSTVTLNLTINYPTSSLWLDSALGSYVWNGNTYSASGTYTALFTNLLGCDSTAILELLIFANTWDCVGGSCIDPGTGQGTYASLSACQSNCVLPTWDCISGVVCVDQGTGQGTYASLSACQANCSNTSIEEHNINNFKIYPNPSSDIFNITFNSETIQDLSIRILNVVGAEIYLENKADFIGEYTKQISLDDYGKGIYFLEIRTSTGVVNKKLILQ